MLPHLEPPALPSCLFFSLFLRQGLTVQPNLPSHAYVTQIAFKLTHSGPPAPGSRMLDYKRTMPCLALSALHSPLMQPEFWSGDDQLLLSHLVLSPVSVTFVLTQETQRMVQQDLLQIHSARKGQS